MLYYLLEEKKKKNRFGEAYAHFIESKPISYISLLFLSFHFPSIFFPSSLPSSKWSLRKKKIYFHHWNCLTYRLFFDK